MSCSLQCHVPPTTSPRNGVNHYHAKRRPHQGRIPSVALNLSIFYSYLVLQHVRGYPSLKHEHRHRNAYCYPPNQTPNRKNQRNRTKRDMELAEEAIAL